MMPGIIRQSVGLLLFVALLFGAGEAFAQAVCTYNNAAFDINPPAVGGGVISVVIAAIKAVLLDVAKKLFEAIITNSDFRDVVAATLSLYIAIYGVLFLIGAVQATIADVVLRVVKFSIVAMLLKPEFTWTFFYSYVGGIFDIGTDELIREFIKIAVGGIAMNPGDFNTAPFYLVDVTFAKLFSAKMFVTLMALPFTGPYGLLFTVLLVLAAGAFIAAVFQSIWIYIMALAVRTLLLGLGPIFMVFLLFNPTRHLFQGWINQLLNTLLQPVLLFAFFAFFAKLIEAAIDRILGVHLCWTNFQSIRGTPFDVHYWRFAIPGRNEPYSGTWGWGGPTNVVGGPVFPIDIMNILIFVLLAQLAWKFNSVVVQLAKDIAGAATSFNMRGTISEFGRSMQQEATLSSRKQREDEMRRGRQVGRRAGPPGTDGEGGGGGAVEGMANAGRQLSGRRV